MEEWEAAKAAGNAAVKDGDFAAADEHYSRALRALPDNDEGIGANGATATLHATLLCNRAHALHQLREFGAAVTDATLALELLPEGGTNSEGTKLRVKALYRRALAREETGALRTAFQDLNLALKISPTNEGIQAAARRVKATLPPESPAALAVETGKTGGRWAGGLPFDTMLVMRCADSSRFAGRLRGYAGATEDPVVRFASGLGVKVYYESGTLQEIAAYGQPGVAPDGIVTLAEDFACAPNFKLADNGLVAAYAREDAHLERVFSLRGGMLNGPQVALLPSGGMDHEASAVYKDGRLDSAVMSSDIDRPIEIVVRTLAELVVPIKKALDIDLTVGERKLCDDLGINVDCVHAADLEHRKEAFVEHQQWSDDRRKVSLRPVRVVANGVELRYPELPAHLRGSH